MLKRLLSHPLTRGLDLDNPDTTTIRKDIIESKPFLKKIYLEWYSLITDEILHLPLPILEIGSGAGYLKKRIPGLISSDIFFLPFVDLIFNGLYVPLKESSISAITMLNVFHHIPDPEKFLFEAERILMKGGRIVFIEPWVSTWSKIVYTHFHHEGFNLHTKKWKFSSRGPLSDSNQALPWIVFERDIKIFQKKFNALQVKKIQPLMPFRYLLSGGISLRNIIPSWTYGLWKKIDQVFEKESDKWGMFALIVVEKIK